MAGDAAGIFLYVARRWRYLCRSGVGARGVSEAAAYKVLGGASRALQTLSLASRVVIAMVANVYTEKTASKRARQKMAKPAQNPRVRKPNQLPGARSATASRPQEPSESPQPRVQRQLKISISAVRWARQTLVESALVKLTTAAAGRDRRGTRRSTRIGSVARARAAHQGLWEDP